MKSILITIGLIFALLQPGSGQVPQTFSYQAVLRNNDGTVMSNQGVNISIKLRKSSISGPVIFTEPHNPTTTGQGLISLNIGSINTADFASIPWNENIYIQVDVKKMSETNFQTIGPSQILSVPYALSAGNVRMVKSQPNANLDDPIFEVRNKDGDVVFAVYQDGVKVFVDDSPGIKGAKGGFAVGGLSQTKAERKEYFKVNMDTSYFATTLYTSSNIVSTGTVNTGVGTLSDELIDIETNKYKTIKIGNQIWMKENLRVTKYSDGTPMNPLTEFAIYNMSPDSDTLNNFGRLYSQGAILSGNNVCPTGWHVPTDADWIILLSFVGGPNWSNDRLVTGLKLMETGTTATGGLWNVQNNLATNVSGFSGRPGGQGYHSTSWLSFINMGLVGNWWSYIDPASADRYSLDGNLGEISKAEGTPGEAYSVRCIKD